MAENYIHGLSKEEQERLDSQANFLETMIHDQLDLSGVRQLLEVGVGVGAQSRLLLSKNPNLHIFGIDISEEQIAQAQQNLGKEPAFEGRFQLQQADASSLELPTTIKPDAAFFCWVLEHVPNPLKTLTHCRSLLQPDSQIFVTEVYNQSQYLYPDSPAIMSYWAAYNRMQAEFGGHPNVGAKLGSLLQEAGYRDIHVYPIYQHHDKRDVDKRKRMILYFEELLMSAKDNLLKHAFIQPQLVDQVHQEIDQFFHHPDAVFFYSGFQATAKS